MASSSFSYVAIDASGAETRGTIEVSDQMEALRRIRQMGLFPTKLLLSGAPKSPAAYLRRNFARRSMSLPWPGWGIKSATLAVFTRQLATLMQAGMPLLRSFRILQEQQPNRTLQAVLGDLANAVESGSSFSEALAQHPKTFNRLYVNMVRAGELGGALDLSLQRLAEFMERSQRIKAKVKAALYYPCAVLIVAAAILLLLLTYIVPRFRAIFEGLTNGAALPAFSIFVFRLSENLRSHGVLIAFAVAGTIMLFLASLRTKWGRWSFDRFKFSAPLLGPLFRKAAIARFARTLGTLVGSGVPILQSLTIVGEAAGNVLLSKVIAGVHDQVQQGEPMAPFLKTSGLFPPIAASMVDVGEQTGALPEMLLKIADNYSEEVDNAANALTSLLEPVMIVFLAVVVGSIVIAVFLPLVHIDPSPTDVRGGE